jgi:hypothetical protein
MIRKQDLRDRIKILEDGLSLRVPVVDGDGEPVMAPRMYYAFGITEHSGIQRPKMALIPIKDAIKSLQDVCGLEITYQEIKGKSGVVIYEREDV